MEPEAERRQVDEDDFDDSNAIDTVTQCSKSPMGL